MPKAKAAKKPKAKKLVTAIVVDYMGSQFGERTPEMEIADHKERWGELVAPCKLQVYTPRGTYPGELRDSTDLVLYDFGGLMPGNNLMESNARHLAQWAADHPNALIVMVSVFTYERYFKYEAEDLGLTELHNVVVDDSLNFAEGQVDCMPDWFKHAHGITGVTS
jgi:hypothetical protein